MGSGGWLVVSAEADARLTDDQRAQYERVFVLPDARPGYAYVIDRATLRVTNIVTGKSS